MTLRILHYADLEDTYDDPKRIGMFAGLIDFLRDENTVIIGAGDNIAPSGLGLLTDGHQAIELFTMIEPDIDTVGNHDFDYGLDTLFSVINSAPQRWICANAYVHGKRFGRDAGIVPWTVIERTGYRLGLFGLAHPNTDTSSPKARSLSFTDPIPAAKEAVKALQNEAVDQIICVSHLGKSKGRSFSDDDDLARAIDIDVILGGHEHGAPRIDRLAETLLVRTTGEGKDVTELRFTGEWTAKHHPVTHCTSDRTIERRFHELHERAGLNEVVATISNPIVQSTETRYLGESRLGNAIADAYRWKTNSDVGLQHSSGIRGTTLQGVVEVADLVSLLPFDMAVVRTTVSGTTLYNMLASGGEIVYPSNPNYWHLHVSGCTVTFDYTQRRVREATVNGVVVDPSTQYTVAAPENFIRSFDCPSNEAQSFGRQYEVLAEYVRENGLNPELEGRIKRKQIQHHNQT